MKKYPKHPYENCNLTHSADSYGNTKYQSPRTIFYKLRVQHRVEGFALWLPQGYLGFNLKTKMQRLHRNPPISQPCSHPNHPLKDL